jgi:hypothetical protein
VPKKHHNISDLVEYLISKNSSASSFQLSGAIFIGTGAEMQPTNHLNRKNDTLKRGASLSLFQHSKRMKFEFVDPLNSGSKGLKSAFHRRSVLRSIHLIDRILECGLSVAEPLAPFRPVKVNADVARVHIYRPVGHSVAVPLNSTVVADNTIARFTSQIGAHLLHKKLFTDFGGYSPEFAKIVVHAKEGAVKSGRCVNPINTSAKCLS